MIAMLKRRWRQASPRTICAAGWLGFLIYAYPGYMSYDSVVQLLQARSGFYNDGHPPMMSALWALTDWIVAGPLGMLLVQSACFVAGAYLVFRRCMPGRAAAIATVALLWFPPIAVVLAVIWKDSQMVAYLLLGTGLLLLPSRGARLAGLAALLLATAMRHNAFAMTLPIIALLFVWNPDHRWWRRYPLAVGAWVVVTLLANLGNRLLADEHRHLWVDSLAVFDITGTLRYAPDIPDIQLRDDLAGTPLIPTAGIQAVARDTYRADSIREQTLLTFGTGTYVPALWITTHHLFELPPKSDAEREAITRAWKRIVLAYPAAYLQYRWHVFRERIHLGDREIPSAAYVWFTDVLDLSGSARKVEHAAVPSKLQARLRDAMSWLGASWIFRPFIYIALGLLLVPLCIRGRELAIVVSGLVNEAVLFVLAPTIDYRYSVWLVVATLIGGMCRLTTKLRSDPASE